MIAVFVGFIKLVDGIFKDGLVWIFRRNVPEDDFFILIAANAAARTLFPIRCFMIQFLLN